MQNHLFHEEIARSSLKLFRLLIIHDTRALLIANAFSARARRLLLRIRWHRIPEKDLLNEKISAALSQRGSGYPRSDDDERHIY